MSLHLHMALKGENSWLISPTTTANLSECSRVCNVRWNQEKDSDILTYWRVKVESSCDDTKRRYCMDAAQTMLRDSCRGLDNFIHKMFCLYEGKLSSVDLDAARGWVYLVFRTHPNGLEKCKEMLTNWWDVLERFSSHFTPSWFKEQQGCSLGCECQPVKFVPEVGELTRGVREARLSDNIPLPIQEDSTSVSNLGDESDEEEDDPEWTTLTRNMYGEGEAQATPEARGATQNSGFHDDPPPAVDAAEREPPRQQPTAHEDARSDIYISEFEAQADQLREEARQLLHRLRVSESDVLVMSLMQALFEESKDTPRAKTLDTVLVLDCSDSMKGRPLEDLKKAAHSFLEGVEAVAEERGLEENVAVVAMGDGARVVQHLTNDYVRVRLAIDSLTAGGLSPLFEAMCVGAAEARKRGGVLHAAGVHKIPPRMILFTDGRVTNECLEDGSDLGPADANVKIRLMRLAQHITEGERWPKPLVWVPLGRDPGRDFMKALGPLCKGASRVVEPSHIRGEADYFFLQDAVAKVYRCAKQVGTSREQVAAVLPALVENISPEQQAMVVDEVMEKIANKGSRESEGQATDWQNVRERPELPPLGTRVIRGPDWKWQNQDTEGPGTVINHDEDKYLVWVTWDNGSTNCYRCGHENAYDVLPVDTQTCPRPQVPGEMIDIGYTVVRGPDWPRQDQDGGQPGVVIRKKEGMVKVRWPNGHISIYHYGKNGKFDLKICEEEACAGAEGGEPQFSMEDGFDDLLDEPGVPVWQWLGEDGQWTDFHQEVSDNIEITFSKNLRSCLTRLNGSMYRVIFSKMIARSSEHGDRMPMFEVRRNLV